MINSKLYWTAFVDQILQTSVWYFCVSNLWNSVTELKSSSPKSLDKKMYADVVVK